MLVNEMIKMRIRTVVIFLVMVAVLISVVALRPFVDQIFGSISQEQIPNFVKKLMGDPQTLLENLKKDDYYLWSQWFGKNLVQFIPLIALVIAFPIFAREIEHGTIHYLLTRSTRLRVYWSKSLTGLLINGLLLLILSILPVFITLALGWDVNYQNFPGYVVQAVCGGSFFFSLYLVFSVVSKDQVKPIVLGIVVMIGDAFLGMLKPLRFLNLYPYMSGSSVYLGLGVDWRYTFALTVLSVFLLLFGWYYFQRSEY
mgnify:CR=1 FL=1